MERVLRHSVCLWCESQFADLSHSCDDECLLLFMWRQLTEQKPTTLLAKPSSRNRKTALASVFQHNIEISSNSSGSGFFIKIEYRLSRSFKLSVGNKIKIHSLTHSSGHLFSWVVFDLANKLIQLYSIYRISSVNTIIHYAFPMLLQSSYWVFFPYLFWYHIFFSSNHMTNRPPTFRFCYNIWCTYFSVVFKSSIKSSPSFIGPNVFLTILFSKVTIASV